MPPLAHIAAPGPVFLWKRQDATEPHMRTTCLVPQSAVRACQDTITGSHMVSMCGAVLPFPVPCYTTTCCTVPRYTRFLRRRSLCSLVALHSLLRGGDEAPGSQTLLEPLEAQHVPGLARRLVLPPCRTPRRTTQNRTRQRSTQLKGRSPPGSASQYTLRALQCCTGPIQAPETSKAQIACRMGLALPAKRALHCCTGTP